MTHQLRARVTHLFGTWWLAELRPLVSLSDRIRYNRCARSWPEAMQAAYQLLRDYDREQMDAVHASRAQRRADRTDHIGCTALHLPACGHDSHALEATA